MAKFRFPGKALKLNTRKRVRFRGSYPTNTPEELYTRRIRRGLDLFHQLFGDSDEDEDGFDGFENGLCIVERRVLPSAMEKKTAPLVRAAVSEKKKVEEVCASLEKDGLVRRTRTSTVAMAVNEVREERERRVSSGLDERTRVRTSENKVVVVSDASAVVDPVPGVVMTRQNKVPISGHSAALKQTNCRMGRQPTVKTALAKKLLAKAKKKLPSLPVVGEKSPKRFILPTKSARSSRIIKPNKRLFADITEMCSTSDSVEVQQASTESPDKVGAGLPGNRMVKLRKSRGSSHARLFRNACSSKGGEGMGRDRMRRTISLYTEAITGPCRGQVGRPPKRLLRRPEVPYQEVETELPDSPQKCDAKESRVKEKIEKLLRSPWDNRLKQSGKVGKCDMDEMMPAPASTTSPGLSAASALSRNILRKARLNLNKSTLQKIRDPTSLQRLIPQSEEGKIEGKCIICDRDEGENSRKFGIIMCELCSSFISSASDGPKEVFECIELKGTCQVQGLVEEERCFACWLGSILQACFMPSLLHDRLRKRLPPVLKDKIPTSLARSMSVSSLPTVGEKDAELTSHTKRLPLDPGGPGGGGSSGVFGNVMDLPGGWKRKTGSEVIVISPSGEKFRSMQKLEEFLKNQGISADARVLFGNSSPVVGKSSDAKSRSTSSTKNSSTGRVVMTTLPGGWTRRIKWRGGGDRFDVYVSSPDGRSFRSRRELSAYFQQIGKIDDIFKYFPVVNGNSDSATPSSSDLTGSSSTEPVSSSEIGSDASSDDKSPEVSEVEFDVAKTEAGNSKGKSKSSKSKSKHRPNLAEVKKTLSPTFKAADEPSDKISEDEVAIKPSKVKILEDEVIKPSKVKITKEKSKKIPKEKSKQKGRSLERQSESERDHRKSLLSGRISESEKDKCGGQSPNKAKELGQKDGDEGTSSNVISKSVPEIKKIERKVKKSKGSRSRSLSVGSKQKDNSQTDTTESESESRLFKQESLFGNNLGRNRSLTADAAVPEAFSPEKNRPLCTAWNTILCDSDLDSDFLTPASYSSSEKSPLLEPLNQKKKKNNLNQFSAQVGKTSPLLEPLNQKKKKNNLNQFSAQVGKTSPTQTHKKPSAPNEVKSKSKFRAEIEGSGSAADKTVSRKMKSSGSLQVKLNEEKAPMTNLCDSVGSETKLASSMLTSKLKMKKKKKTSNYQSVSFGNNWSRKIKWNDKGEGKVALLHSPDGQTIRSSIELLAYFKKAGNTRVDLDYYFPPVLKRETIPSPVRMAPPSPADSVEDDVSHSMEMDGFGHHTSEASDLSDSESFFKTSEDSCASTEEGGRKRRNRTAIADYSRLSRDFEGGSSLVDAGRKRIVHLAKSGRKIVTITGKSGKFPIIKCEPELVPSPLDPAGGPRVKHVCRSQAQVLGIQRAVFPSPEKDGKPDFETSPILEGKKRKFVTDTQKPSGRVPLKTMWCNKCSGCTTPNCKECVNCLDMKKFGGPGTKKKPCIMRKCLNPRLSAKSRSAILQEKKLSKRIQSSDTKERSKSPIQVEEKSIVVSKPEPVEKKKADIIIKVSTQDKSAVFIPRQMTRTQPDQKDRVDIAAGKKFVPGALVNIDFWQGYDVDEMMLSGFAVTTSSSLYPQSLCFRCGSAGKERLIFCIWCCEGVHPFCMEDGEGPESDTEEMFWICRRCAVCHVCGAPGADSLLRCSDCRNYYHMECLGPSAHSTCQPSPDRPWEAEMFLHLRHSWPRQAVLYDADGMDEVVDGEDVVVHTELDMLRDDFDLDEPDMYFLPDGAKLSAFVEDLSEGDALDFDLDDAICLEDSVIELSRNVDLYKEPPSLTSNLHGQELFTFAADEYLCLGYKKLIEYASRNIEISYFRLLQIIHNELFDTLGCPTWRNMLKEGLVEENPCGRGLDSETDTASEGESESSDSEWEWDDVLEFRRFEANQELQERRDRKEAEERKAWEMERERARLIRKKEQEKEGKPSEPTPILKVKNKPTPAQKVKNKPTPAQKVKKTTPAQKAKNILLIKETKRRGRPPGTTMLEFIVPNEEDICDGVSSEGQETPKRVRFKQPKSWEEFDRLFSWKVEDGEGKEEKEDHVEESERRNRLLMKKKKKVGEIKATDKIKGKENSKVVSKLSKLDSVKRPRGRPKKLVTRTKIISKKIKGKSGETQKVDLKKLKTKKCVVKVNKVCVTSGGMITKRGRKPNLNSKSPNDDSSWIENSGDDNDANEPLGKLVGKSVKSKKIPPKQSIKRTKDSNEGSSSKMDTISKAKRLKMNSPMLMENVDIPSCSESGSSSVDGDPGSRASDIQEDLDSDASDPDEDVSLNCLEDMNDSQKKAGKVSRKDEKNSDKENHPTHMVPDPVIVNGANETDSDEEDDESASSSEDERTLEETCNSDVRSLKRKQDLNSRCNNVSKNKVQKLMNNKLELSKDEESADINASLITGRRRRSAGRASELASQRKAMMDY